MRPTLPIDDPTALADTFDALEAREQVSVIRLSGPAAPAIAAAWAHGVGAADTFDLMAPRAPAEGAIWLGSGRGAIAAADMLSAWAATRGTRVVLTGRAVQGGHRRRGAHGHARTFRGQAARRPARILPGPIEPTSQGLLDGYRKAEILRTFAALDWASPTLRQRFAWVETLRLIGVVDPHTAVEHAWTLIGRGCDPGWARLVMAWAYHESDMLVPARHVLSWLQEHVSDGVLGTEVQGLVALLDGGPAPEGLTPFMSAVLTQATTPSERAPSPEDTSPAARILRTIRQDPDTVIALGFHSTLQELRVRQFDSASPGRILDTAMAAVTRGEHPAIEWPSAHTFGRFARTAELVRGAQALAAGDPSAVRRSAWRLERLRHQGRPLRALRIAIEQEGPPWARLRWLESLRHGFAEHADIVALCQTRIAALRRTLLTLADYVLDQPIASGAMGTVWAATHAPTDHPVAIKVLKSAHDRDAKLFAREVELVTRLEHPAIVQVLDHGQVSAEDAAFLPTIEAGQVFLVMERVDGGTLADHAGTMGWPELRDVLQALLGALGYAHARGILHRDIKPQNVLVSTDRTLRLTDFGLAGLPTTGHIAGSLPYMAPEQFRGIASVQSDLYAVGALAWTLLRGLPPFLGTTTRLASRPDRLPRDRGIEAVPTLEAWFRKALAVHPGDRFEDTRAMAEALPHAEVEPGEGSTAKHTPRTFHLTTMVGCADAAPLPPSRERVPEALPYPEPRVWSWRPRVPTLRLLRRGDPPVHGQDAAQRALWEALRRAVAGEVVAVELRGLPGTGRGALVSWVRDEGRRAGLPLTEHRDHPPAVVSLQGGDVDAEVAAAVPGTLLIWVRPPDTGHATPIDARLLTVDEVFLSLHSRVHASSEVLWQAATRSCGRVELGIALLEGWAANPGLGPGDEGLELLAPPPPDSPPALAFWRRSLQKLPEDQRASWRLLSHIPGRLPSAAIERVLLHAGLPPVEPRFGYFRAGPLLAMSPELRRVLNDEGPEPEGLLGAMRSIQDLAESVPIALAIRCGSPDVEQRLLAGTTRTAIDPEDVERFWRLLIDRGTCAPATRVVLTALDEPTPWALATIAIRGRRDLLAAACIAQAQQSANRLPPSMALELARLYARLRSAGTPQPFLDDTALCLTQALARSGLKTELAALHQRLEHGGSDVAAYSYVCCSVDTPWSDIQDTLREYRVRVAGKPLMEGMVDDRMATGALEAGDAPALTRILDGVRTPGSILGLVEALFALEQGNLEAAHRHVRGWIVRAENSRYFAYPVLLVLAADLEDWVFDTYRALATPIQSSSLARSLRATARRPGIMPDRARVLESLAHECQALTETPWESESRLRRALRSSRPSRPTR